MDSLKATTRIPEINIDLVRLRPVEKISYELKSDRREPFTLELATKFIEMENFVGERKLNDRHVDFLLEEAKNGRFLGDITALASCTCGWDGKVRRLNGQHTSWMRTSMPKDWCPTVHVLHYKADREEDFRSLYGSFDRILVRSNKHVVVSGFYGTEEFKEISAGNLGRLAAGLRLWTCESSRDTRPIDRVMELMKGKHYKLVIEVSQFLNGISPSSATHMYCRAPVTAAMFATFDKSVSDSLKFWEMVRDGGGSTTHPAQVLMKYLIKTNIRSEPGNRNYSAVPREDMFRICISAWNSFRRGDQIKMLRVLDNRVAAR
jgi:hypothetical protein